MLLARDPDVSARSRNPNGNTPLHAALAGNHKLVAGLLIGAGADVNGADAAGWRPLHLAAANANLDSIKALVAQGADVAAANNEGLTALSLATEKNHREAAALLRRYGA
jgi:ankyrin repeat protein